MGAHEDDPASGTVVEVAGAHYDCSDLAVSFRKMFQAEKCFTSQSEHMGIWCELVQSLSRSNVPLSELQRKHREWNFSVRSISYGTDLMYHYHMGQITRQIW